MNSNFWLSWEFCLLKVLLFLSLGVALDKPVGSIAGRIALEQKGFGLYSYDMRGSRVNVVATLHGDESVERGVWVNADGSFRIDQLPVGEYTLAANATGYATSYESGIFVQEGKVTTLPDRIALSLQRPSVTIASNTRVFTTKDKPYLWINASQSSQAVVKIYRHDLFDVLENKDTYGLEFGSDLNLYSPSSETDEPFTEEKPIKTIERKLRPDQQGWAHIEFKLAKPLPPGDYFAVAEVNNQEEEYDWSVTWFSVTDLGLIVKQAPDKTLVRAIDLNTLKPRQGVRVEVAEKVSSGQDEEEGAKEALRHLGKATTGKDGFALIRLGPDAISCYDIICRGVQGKEHAYGGLYFYSSRSDRYRTYFYTERPVYRLGQTVYYKAIARLVAGEGPKTPAAGTAVKVAIEDPDNDKLWEGSFKTNRFGTITGSFTIPEDGKTGAYQVTLTYPDGSTSYDRFEVAQYRKPEYQVEVIPIEPRVTAGGKAKARIKATYYFGAPVRDARIKYSVYASTDWSGRLSLMPRPSYYSYFDDWGDSDDGYYGDGGGSYVTEGYAQTDATGEATIEFETSKPEPSRAGPYASEYRDKRYRIEAEVTDLSRMSVVSSGSIQVTAGDFVLFVQPDRYVVRAGEQVKANVSAVDYLGQPVPNRKLSLTLTRWVWDRVNYQYKGQEIAGRAEVTTDDGGKASVTFSTKAALPTATYYITAEALDDFNNLIYDEGSLWIASEQYPYALGEREAEREPLALKLDKPVYRPGETAKLMVSAPVTGKEGAEAIVAVEGLTIYDYRVVPLTATAQLVEIPLKRSYAPNVEVTVTFVDKKRQFYNESKSIKVSPEERFLNIAVSTDKQKYRPGEPVTYTITAKHPDGKPASDTELSLGVVDESIYAIRPETAANIQKFFYGRRYNQVVTACSFPEQYSGGPDKLEPRIRKQFKDTAAWLPRLVTNGQGIAKATVTLPDNLTTWRATVRGVSVQTEVGFTTNRIICTQDLILRLALPRFYSEGDQGSVTAVVHNYTDKPQNVTLTLSHSDHFEVSYATQQQLVCQPEKAYRFEWPVKLVRSGEATLLVKAIGQTAADAVERKINIRPLGFVTFAAASGVLNAGEDSVTLPVGLAADASPGTAKYKLHLYASSLGPVLGSFSKLIEYPYGCTEQTMSRFMPSIVAMRLHKSLGLKLAAADKARFDKVYKEGMKKLTDYQHSDGGWGWWKDDDSNPYLTAYVMEGFKLLTQVGYKVDPEITKSGKQWMVRAASELGKQLRDPHLARQFYSDLEARTDLCRMLYSLSLWGEKPQADVCNWLIKEKETLPPEALSYLTLALKRSGNVDAANKAYDRLIFLCNRSGQYSDWDHTLSMVRKFRSGASSPYYSYRFTGVESTALALKAVLTMHASDRDLVESVKSWLMIKRDKDGWQNTKTTAEVFVALLEDELISRSRGEIGISVTASLGGTPLATFSFNKSNIYESDKVVDVPLPVTPAELKIEKSGSGRLYYNSLLTYVRLLKPGDTIAEKSQPDGVRLEREFFRLTPSQVLSDGSVHFTSQPLRGQTKAGETVLMKVYVENPVALPYIILEAALPSGAEVVENDAREALADNRSEEGSEQTPMFQGDWGEWWWTHQDILDDRIVFFVTDLPAGKHEFHTMVRLEMPGTFHMNPVSMEGMYTKNVRAFSGLDTVKVTE